MSLDDVPINGDRTRTWEEIIASALSGDGGTTKRNDDDDDDESENRVREARRVALTATSRWWVV